MVEPPLWKIWKSNGKDDIPYIVEKNMFETTDQIGYNCYITYKLWKNMGQKMLRSFPMTDPWCCYIWCAMHPIYPFMLALIYQHQPDPIWVLGSTHTFTVVFSRGRPGWSQHRQRALRGGRLRQGAERSTTAAATAWRCAAWDGNGRLATDKNCLGTLFNDKLMINVVS